MSEIGPVAAGGFYLETGIPEDYYAFTDGELSLTVERNGGINTLGVLDLLEWNGKLYPDRSMTPPILRREGGLCGKRPLMGPGLQFLSTHRQADSRTIEYEITLQPDEERTLTYTAHYTW